MATTGKKISALDTIDADALASGDMFLVLDTGADLKKIDADDMADAITTPYTRTLLDDLTAGATLTTLGFSSFAQTLIDDADLATLLNTLGIDGDLATFDIPASLDISAYGKTILDDANAAAIRTTLGLTADPWPQQSVQSALLTYSSAGTVWEIAAAGTFPSGMQRLTFYHRLGRGDTDNTSPEYEVYIDGSWKTASYVGCAWDALVAGATHAEVSYADAVNLGVDAPFDTNVYHYSVLNAYRHYATAGWMFRCDAVALGVGVTGSTMRIDTDADITGLRMQNGGGNFNSTMYGTYIYEYGGG